MLVNTVDCIPSGWTVLSLTRGTVAASCFFGGDRPSRGSSGVLATHCLAASSGSPMDGDQVMLTKGESHCVCFASALFLSLIECFAGLYSSSGSRVEILRARLTAAQAPQAEGLRRCAGGCAGSTSGGSYRGKLPTASLQLQVRFPA